MASDKEAAAEAGCAAFIEKPVLPDDVVAIVKHAAQPWKLSPVPSSSPVSRQRYRELKYPSFNPSGNVSPNSRPRSERSSPPPLRRVRCRVRLSRSADRRRLRPASR